MLAKITKYLSCLIPILVLGFPSYTPSQSPSLSIPTSSRNTSSGFYCYLLSNPKPNVTNVTPIREIIENKRSFLQSNFSPVK